MASAHALSRTPAVLLAAACLQAAAQGFSADYDLLRSRPLAEPLVQGAPVRLATEFRAGAGPQATPSAGLALAGEHWLGRFSLGRIENAPAHLPGIPGGDSLGIGGAYRWDDGQALSLQLDRRRPAPGWGGGPGMGLSLAYDWPRYYLRFSWDSRVDFLPVDRLRLSAGIRF